jgi:heptosyltransferase-3
LASDPKTILVIAVPLLGDVLLTTPLIASVKAKWPEADIDVITPPGGAAVLEGNPDVREAMEPRKKPFSAFLGFILRRFRYYDLVLSNSTSDRALTYALVMARRRVSLLNEKRGGANLKRRLYDTIVDYDLDRYNTVTQNLMLLDGLGVERRYDVTLPSSPESATKLDGVLGAGWQDQALAVIHPDSSAHWKRWHKTGWHAVVDWLTERGFRVLVTGGPRQEDIAYVEEELDLSSGPAECLAGRIRLPDVALLLRNSRLYIGVDTLISHMAAAAGIPSIVLFGPINPLTWGPWPKGYEGGDSPWTPVDAGTIGNVTIVQGDPDEVARDQAASRERPGSRSESLAGLPAETVIAAAERALSASTDAL